MQQKDIKAILEKIHSGQYTPEEEAIAKNWLHQLNQAGDSGLSDEDLSAAHSEMWQAIEEGKQTDSKKIKLWPRLLVAASVLFIFSFGYYYFFHNKSSQQIINAKNDIPPGGNKALLTLANGQKISLDNIKNGVIANQGKVSLIKNQDGQLTYKNATAANSLHEQETEDYNILTTPAAGIYNIRLSDGSEVWLNAATSIRYPTVFKGQYRTVELLSGEAYYKVVHNDKIPFRVIAGEQIVEDIGTQFNINFYKDEPFSRTTLLKGSVKIAKGKQTAILKPGQQATIQPNDKNITIENADIEQVTAWKNGNFYFKNDDLNEVLKQISRWYNVDIIMNESISKHYSGTISRQENLSKVLNLLQLASGVHFKIIGNKIIITQS